MLNSQTSLKFVLTRNYILMGLLPLLLIGFASQFILSKSLKKEITTRNYSLATSIAGEVKTFLHEPLSLIQQVSDVIHTPELLDNEDITIYLNSVINNYPFFEMMQYLDSNGRVTFTAPFSNDYIGTDMSRQKFYSTTKQSGKPSWSPTFISIETGSPTLTLSIPSGEGMLVGYLNVTVLSEVVQKLSSSKRYAVITDQEGTVIGDFFLRRVQHRANLRYLEAVQAGLDGIEGTYTVNDRNQKMIASVVQVELTGWLVIFMENYDNAFLPLTQTKLAIYIGTLLTAIIALMAAVFSSSSTIQPLVKLAHHVKKVADGNYALSREKFTFHEIQDLGNDVRKMAEAIMLREQNLAESERLHRELIETIPYGVQENDLQGIITFTNSAYDKIFEYSPNSAVGKQIWANVVDKKKEAQLKQYFSYLVKEQPAPTIYYQKSRTATGKLIDIKIDWLYKRDSSGVVTGFISVITDITEQKQLEENLRQSQKMEAVGTLAGGIAHDFNNLLAAIIGYSELVLDNLPPDSSNHEDLQQVLKASFRAKDLIQHLLLFSRKQELRKTSIDISSVVNESTTLLRATIPSTIRFDLNIKKDVGKIKADSTQIQQVIINLCTNSAYAMGKQGGVLTITLDTISINETGTRPGELSSGKYAHLQIQDNGTGIESEKLGRIFEPFFTTKDTGKGTGMGLAVVHGIVNSHGGAISVTSKLQLGTIFDVYFPLLEQSDELKKPFSDIPHGNNEKIVIVDDEESVAISTSALLNRLNYSTVTFTDSKTALEYFRSNHDKCDLVITDQTMPNLTGIDLARQLLLMRSDLPIILFSGYSATITEADALEAGIKAFIMKPMTREKLANRVYSLLHSS